MKHKTPDYKKILTPSDLELNTCSNQDCTGLIPSAIQNSAQADSYEELYPYITPPDGKSSFSVQEKHLNDKQH